MRSSLVSAEAKSHMQYLGVGDLMLMTLPPEFFYKTHDPTTLNRQGNDAGTRTSPLLPLVLFPLF
jgi:hypothetical protein